MAWALTQIPVPTSQSKKEMLEGRLNALQQQFSKQQSSEAEKFKVLDMMLRRLQDEVSHRTRCLFFSLGVVRVYTSGEPVRNRDHWATALP